MPSSEPLSNPLRQPLVDIQGLRKRYRSGEWVLDEVNLQATDTDFVSLLGPSGCGKTTLLKLLAGLLSASAGSLRVGGNPPDQARETISFVFQEPTLLPWQNARSNIELPMRLRGYSKAARQQRSDELLKLVGLSDAGHLYPRELSGGMRMRIAVARALAITPRLMLLDEPFGAVDAMTRNQLNVDLLRLRALKGWAVFFVTHSVAEAVFLSSRILVFSRNPGRIAEEVAVPFPYPRDASLREESAYHEKVRETFHALRMANPEL